MAHNRFVNFDTAWCPGCGNFVILETLAKVLNEFELARDKVLLVGGIGRAAKPNPYTDAGSSSGLHGRALPDAAGAKIANEELTVSISTGDGDSCGEGGKHFLHNLRRNVDITHFVNNNQIYGLTRRQPTPSPTCMRQGQTGACSIGTVFNPLEVAIAAGATFVARSFSGNKEHLAKMMKAAIQHKGYALLDIFQPCVSFHKMNTCAYYSTRVYELDESYDPANKLAALEKSTEQGDQIAIGILYQEAAPTYYKKRPHLFDGTRIDKKQDTEKVNALIHAF